MTPQPFTAVLLAGGKSTRMGTDKAAVLFDGQPLWKRQLGTLRELDLSELFISGRVDGPYAEEGIEILKDIHPGAGPLAGLEAALQRANTAWIVIVAIDLPAMNSAFLARLVTLAIRTGRSIIPFDGEWFEPLAAVFSPAVLELAKECLQGRDHSMQNFITRAVALDLAAPYRLSTEEMLYFKNVNEPGDLG